MLGRCLGNLKTKHIYNRAKVHIEVTNSKLWKAVIRDAANSKHWENPNAGWNIHKIEQSDWRNTNS